MQKHTLGEVGN